jgi:hypothetical protein
MPPSVGMLIGPCVCVCAVHLGMLSTLSFAAACHVVC